MKHFSIVNRGYSYYRVHTKKDKECVNLRNEIKQSNNKLDMLTSTKLNIKIEDDWIIEIEEGIRHIAEAVGQERQFIATTGEVIPIEKVKRVSKASIVHLAKHSDLISRLPEEGEILIPDKVYMEEKVSDYAVYENRFLFTLLTYLQQFVNMRLEKINETIRTYKGSLSLNKNVQNKNYNFSFELSYKEERYDILNSMVDEDTKALINRLDMISREIISLLACPLMKDVSKAPLVSTPLVKTNVLKNNKNFKAAVLLFDFINNCEKDGYEITEVNDSFTPFNNDISDDYAELVKLTSFITYKNSNRLNDSFKKEIEIYEQELKNKEIEELDIKIDKIKKGLVERDMTAEEYILILEKRNNELQEENSSIILFKNKIEELENEKIEFKKEIVDKDNLMKNLNLSIEELNNEVVLLNQKYEEEVHIKNTIEQECNERINVLRDEIINELNEDFENKKISLIEEFSEKQKESNSHFEELETELNETLASSKDELSKIKDELKKALNDKSFALAQLLALRIKMNINTAEDDYTSKERFKELEEQYFIFEQFFSEEWKRTKKKLRKQYLSNK